MCTFYFLPQEDDLRHSCKGLPTNLLLLLLLSLRLLLHALRGDAEELTLDLEIEDEDEDHRAAFIACTGGEVGTSDGWKRNGWSKETWSRV